MPRAEPLLRGLVLGPRELGVRDDGVAQGIRAPQHPPSQCSVCQGRAGLHRMSSALTVVLGAAPTPPCGWGAKGATPGV